MLVREDPRTVPGSHSGGRPHGWGFVMPTAPYRHCSDPRINATPTMPPAIGVFTETALAETFTRPRPW